MSATDDLIKLLKLEPIEENLFRGYSPPEERQRIFGGQVVAQALMAAYQTVQGRDCHSLQSYFIRPGDPALPVLYQVERSREGKSFATRRVIAIQKGEQIFNMACSFQISEAGYEHQDAMPAVTRAEDLPEEFDRLSEELRDAPQDRKRWLRQGPIDSRPVDPIPIFAPRPAPSIQYTWLRLREDPGDGVALNQVLLAYASDYSLLGTSMRPHGVNWFTSGVQTASLDHIIWFHRATNFSRWHLYVQDSPFAAGARGFNRGAIYREDGVLVASVAQEGLIRPPRG
ncbi:MAG: acyl-CoA thioesterase II [Hyphomonadaceae bacterium]